LCPENRGKITLSNDPKEKNPVPSHPSSRQGLPRDEGGRLMPVALIGIGVWILVEGGAFDIPTH
jgi:hypothetical protein